MNRGWLRPHLRLQLDDLHLLLLHFLSQQLDLDVRAENIAPMALLSERHVDVAALRPVGLAVAAQPIADSQREDHLARTRSADPQRSLVAPSSRYWCPTIRDHAVNPGNLFEP